MTYKKGSKDALGVYFTAREFDCPCQKCTETIIDPELVNRLESMRVSIGKPLRINSGYRCSNYQTELRLRGYETSTGPSQHELGRAVDVMRADSQSIGLELEKEARKAGFKAVGVGSSWIHCDLRDDVVRRWEYKSR